MPTPLLTGAYFPVGSLISEIEQIFNFLTLKTKRRCRMPKFLGHGSYTEAGLKGLIKEGGTKRRETLKQAIE